MAERFRGVEAHPFSNGFDLTLRPERLNQPLNWRFPRMIFVNSMSDLFHKDISAAYVHAIFDVMERAEWHIFQILTKRSSRMKAFVRERYVDRLAPAHIWLGASLEDGSQIGRIRHIQETAAAVRFLSIEPLLGAIGALSLRGIDWVIVGGESGPRARPMRVEWVRPIRDQCVAACVPFFFKQWGGPRPKSGGRALDGTEWNQFPKMVGHMQRFQSGPAHVAA